VAGEDRTLIAVAQMIAARTTAVIQIYAELIGEVPREWLAKGCLRDRPIREGPF
jgi:hypothetical protein